MRDPAHPHPDLLCRPQSWWGGSGHPPQRQQQNPCSLWAVGGVAAHLLGLVRTQPPPHPCAELCKDSPPCRQDHCNPPTSSSPTSPGSAEPRCFPYSQSYRQSLVTLRRQEDGICLSSYKCTFFISLFGGQTKLLTEPYSIKSCCQLVCKSTFSILHLRKLKLKG